MQKTHKSKGGTVWGNIKKKTVSIFIHHSFIQHIPIEQLQYMANCWSYKLYNSPCLQVAYSLIQVNYEAMSEVST